MRRLEQGAGSGLLDTVFVLILLCVLTGVSLFLVSLGAELYQEIAADMTRNFQLETSLTYVANKVRRADAAGMVQIGEFREVQALILMEEYDGERYNTWIYCHEGNLMELFGEADGDFQLQDGTALLLLGEFTFKQEDNFLDLQAVSEDGARDTLHLALRSEPPNPTAEVNIIGETGGDGDA